MPTVNPKILRWARETAELTLEEAARKIGINDTRSAAAHERLNALETGQSEPTRRQLVSMSKHYRRPLVAFYLPEPPRVGPRGHDFRTLPPDYSRPDEALIDALVRELMARQSLVRSALEDDEDTSPNKFVGSANQSDGVHALATSIQSALGIEPSQLTEFTSPQKLFDYLREQTEMAGFFVLLIGNLGSHHTNLPVETFRGIALADSIAPFVIINDQDSPAAWSFTLIHELAHLWLGQTGISGQSIENNIERFCNDVASEFLLPDDVIMNLPIERNSDTETIEEIIRAISSERSVSHSMVAYKLYRKNKISRSMWEELSDHFRQMWLDSKTQDRRANQNRSGGPDYYVVRKHRIGKHLLQVTGRLLHEGSLTTSKAGRVLGAKPSNVGRLLER